MGYGIDAENGFVGGGTLAGCERGNAEGGAQGPASEQTDKYTWLEDIHGDKSMEWVKAENARTAAVMEKQKPFAELDEAALKVLDSPDKLAFPQFRAGMVYNTWRDKDHVRGIVRRTTLNSYLSNDPKWETVIDYDALGKQDKQSWVGHGLDCMAPEEEHCMVALSASGEDAVTLREFNLKTGTFVEGGFVMPRGKQQVAWLDQDTLLIGRDWGPGTMSEAGYPITVRKWKRGTPLESAVEVYRGLRRTMGSATIRCAGGWRGHHMAVIVRNMTTFEHEWYLLLSSGPKKLSLPLKSSLEDCWTINCWFRWMKAGHRRADEKHSRGAVVSLDTEAAKADPVHLKPTMLFAPTPQEFAQQVATTKNHVLLTTLEHVQGRAYVYTHGKDGRWTRSKLAVPDNESIGISTTSLLDDRFFLSETGFLTPSSVLLGDAADGSLKEERHRRRSSIHRTMWRSSLRLHRRTGRRYLTLWFIAKTFPWMAARRRC